MTPSEILTELERLADEQQLMWAKVNDEHPNNPEPLYAGLNFLKGVHAAIQIIERERVKPLRDVINKLPCQCQSLLDDVLIFYPNLKCFRCTTLAAVPEWPDK